MSAKSDDQSKFEQQSEWGVIDILLEGKGPGDVDKPVRSSITELVQSDIISAQKRQGYDRRAFAAQHYLKPENNWLREAPELEDKWEAISWLIKAKRRVGEVRAVETIMRSLEYGEKVPRDNPQYRWAAAAADRASSDYIQNLVQETKDGINFCQHVQENWQRVREEIKDTYNQNQPPEKSWSQSYCYDIRRAAQIYLEAEEEIEETESEETSWDDFLY